MTPLRPVQHELADTLVVLPDTFEVLIVVQHRPGTTNMPLARRQVSDLSVLVVTSVEPNLPGSVGLFQHRRHLASRDAQRPNDPVRQEIVNRHHAVRSEDDFRASFVGITVLEEKSAGPTETLKPWPLVDPEIV